MNNQEILDYIEKNQLFQISNRKAKNGFLKRIQNHISRTNQGKLRIN